jgi:hypothetical protein
MRVSPAELGVYRLLIILHKLHIIGLQKAGTTAPASFLHQHPSICLVDGKEAHVFDHPLYSEQSDKMAFANTIYKSKLTNYQDQPIVCDATPITVFRPEFMQACHQYNPNAKFILILRDPVERAISHYRMSQSRGQEQRSLLGAFLMEPFRLNGMNRSSSWSFDSPFRNHSYLSRGLYSKQLRKVYNMVPKNSYWSYAKRHCNTIMMKSWLKFLISWIFRLMT